MLLYFRKKSYTLFVQHSILPSIDLLAFSLSFHQDQMNINLIIIFILQDLLGDYFLVHSHTILSRLIYPFIFYFSLLISPTVLTSHPCFSSLPIYLFRAYYWWWLAGSNWGNICWFQDSSVGCFSTSHCHSRRNIYH